MMQAPSGSTIASATIGPAIAVVAFWIFELRTGIKAPGEVQVAGGAIISAAVGYVFRGGQQRDVT